jgi:dephospho-CoA kinase
VLTVGLTGGIGSGKSTVAAALAERGAVVLSADVVARAVLAPGEPALDAVRQRFGDGVIAGDGSLDREALAAVVFADERARLDLEEITHPLIRSRLRTAAEHWANTDRIVVLEIPLLDSTSWRHYHLDVVVVVDAPPDEALRRVVRSGRLSEDQARRRAEAQISTAERLGLADRVISNAGHFGRLESEVNSLWEWLRQRADSRPPQRSDSRPPQRSDGPATGSMTSCRRSRSCRASLPPATSPLPSML